MNFCENSLNLQKEKCLLNKSLDLYEILDLSSYVIRCHQTTFYEDLCINLCEQGVKIRASLTLSRATFQILSYMWGGGHFGPSLEINEGAP